MTAAPNGRTLDFPNAARIARRELRGGVKGFRVFLACLALGVAAIAAVGSVRTSIEQGLAREGAAILGGDAEIELTHRFATPEERAAMDDMALDVSEIVDFRSMIVVDQGGQTERALTQAKGVDGKWPLYGAPVLEPAIPLETALAGDGTLPGGVMDPGLMARLGIEVGDTFRLGEQDYHLSAALIREPDEAGGNFNLGPRTLVRTADLQRSGLLSAGTVFETAYRLKLAPGTDLEMAEETARARLDSVGMRWRDSRNGAPGVARFVERLGAFLVLVGLAGLAVGGVGVSSAVRAFLNEKTETIATLKTLGAETGTIFVAYGLQIAVLTVLGLGIGLGLGAIVPLALAPVIEAQLPLPAVFAVHPGPLAEAALYGVLAAALFTLWPLARTESVRAAELFRGGAERSFHLPRWPYRLATVTILALLIAAAARFSGLATLTFWSAGGLFAAFLALLGVASITRIMARRLARLKAMRGRPALRMALGSVGGPGSEAGSVVLSLGLGLTVLAAVGQIDANLRGAIARDLPDVAPSYFVVDIQTDQLPDFLVRTQDHPGVERVETAPMLRGVVSEINGKPAREVAGNHWALRGDRGITYSDALPSGAEVTSGTWWPEGYDGPPQISFAAEEGEELGLTLGDRLTVNVLGRDIEAEITSFRNVDFSTAGIGFVLSMNPAALAGAPHTHIATIYADPASDGALLRDLGGAFPNITLIRVRDAIDRVTEVLGGIAGAITYGAMAALVTGVVVLIGAAAAGERARTYEAAILKTLGASRAFILANFALRSAIFGLAAGLVAIVAGGLAGWGVSRFVMDTAFHFEPLSAIAIVFGGAVTSMLAGLAFAWRPLAARPARVLRDSD